MATRSEYPPGRLVAHRVRARVPVVFGRVVAAGRIEWAIGMRREEIVKRASRLVFATVLALASPVRAEAFPPFRVVADVYYVGDADAASYLITTPEGHILVNSNLAADVPQIRSSIESLGFKYMVMDEDVPVVESGGKEDFQYGGSAENWYEPAKVDRVLHDGDRVTLGTATLVAHKTPGHTKGCTTWTLEVDDQGRARQVVIVGSANVNPGYALRDNARYPTIARDYETTFEVLKALRCDYFLGAHAGYFDLAAKYARMKGGQRDVFVDPAGYKAFVADREAAFREKLASRPAGGSKR